MTRPSMWPPGERPPRPEEFACGLANGTNNRQHGCSACVEKSLTVVAGNIRAVDFDVDVEVFQIRQHLRENITQFSIVLRCLSQRSRFVTQRRPIHVRLDAEHGILPIERIPDSVECSHRLDGLKYFDCWEWPLLKRIHISNRLLFCVQRTKPPHTPDCLQIERRRISFTEISGHNVRDTEEQKLNTTR